MNSLITEEKDDAVTSAGSEERCMAFGCGDTSNFDSAAASIGEMESDGAVTSVGTETQDGSTIIENPDEFQNNTVGAEQIKAAEDAVTCTGTERPNAICSISGMDSKEVSVVNGVYAEMDNNEEIGPLADKSEDIISGESAVTSTGIMAEDDHEAATTCTGLEDSDEGLVAPLDTEEKYEHATDSTEARGEKNITETSQGSYDEDCVTSTGSKEEEEESEDVVTSTGGCNEESEHVALKQTA